MNVHGFILPHPKVAGPHSKKCFTHIIYDLTIRSSSLFSLPTLVWCLHSGEPTGISGWNLSRKN